MGNKFRNILFAVASALAFASCGNKNNSHEVVVTQEDVEEFTLETVEFHDSFPIVKGTQNPKLVMNLVMQAPKVGDSKAGDEIFKELAKIATTQRSLDFKNSALIFKDSLLSAYGSDNIDDLRDIEGYYVEYKISHYYEDTQLYVAGINTCSYMGGAHGYYCQSYAVFDKHTGCQYELSDFFGEKERDVLSRLIKDKLVKEHKAKDVADLENAGFIFPEDIKASENIALSADTISFFYCPYEIACYAMGELSVGFSYSEIKHLLKPNSPIKHLTK